MSSLTNNCTCHNALHCAWKEITAPIHIRESGNLWEHPKASELEKLQSVKPKITDPSTWILKEFHGTTAARIEDQLKKITLGKQDTLDKRENLFYFAPSKEMCSYYAWPRQDQGEIPVLLRVLVKGGVIINERDQAGALGNQVYPLHVRELLSDKDHTMCKPAKMKLKQMGRAGLGGVAAITAVVAGKYAYDHFQTLKEKPTTQSQKI